MKKTYGRIVAIDTSLIKMHTLNNKALSNKRIILDLHSAINRKKKTKRRKKKIELYPARA